MDTVLRVVALYAFLLLVFRLVGRRTLGEATPFDLLLLLVLSETTQQALVAQDHSLTTAFLLITTFLIMNVGLSLWKQHSHPVEKVLEGTPLVLLENGQLLQDRMDKVRVDEDDILETARQERGLVRLDQIRLVVLERSGKLAVIPQESSE